MSESNQSPPTRPQPSIILPAELLENPNQEPLKIIVTPYQGVTHLPSDVQGDGTALFVFNDLLGCFKQQGFVAEGLLGNLMWGFEQSGRDLRMVAHGLMKLRQLGYILYSDPIGVPISEHNFIEGVPIWIRYTPKMINLMVRK
jgi:hypothetical protein